MQIHDIPLDRLEAHPHNSNVMGEAIFDKLMHHIERTDQYPPLITRPLPDQDESTDDDSDRHATTVNERVRYQILDGHHRVKALARLGRVTGRCVIWHVDDQRALTLLATLNRLEGRDDPRKRAALLEALQQRGDLDALARDLPEPAAQLKQMAQAHHAPPAPQPPEPSEAMPESMHFFFTPAVRRDVEAKLRTFDANRDRALLKAMGMSH